MAHPPLTLEKRNEVIRLLSQGFSHREINSRTGVSLGAISEIRQGVMPSTDDPTETIKEDGDEREVTKVRSSPIRTLEDAIRVCEVDLSVWYVDRWEAGAWNTGMKLGKVGEETVHHAQNYRVKVFLKRIMPKPLQDATEAIFQRLAKHAPRYKQASRAVQSGEPILAVFGLFDAHFGKMCWASETGDNYDLEIAETVYANAVEDLIADSAGRNIAEIILPVGNDFFHIDNSRNTTFAGTPQDVDGRYAKVIACGEMAVINAVERLATIAPVKVVWVPGNHDPTTSFHLARTVQAWFRNHDWVAVDAGPSPRKYVEFGVNLIGLTHGNEEKTDALAGLMSNEQREAWARSTCREWLIGHMHRSRAWTTKPVETVDSLTVRVLRSLAGTDAWHHRKGYLNLSKAAEVYWYGENRGYMGHAVVPARKEVV